MTSGGCGSVGQDGSWLISMVLNFPGAPLKTTVPAIAPAVLLSTGVGGGAAWDGAALVSGSDFSDLPQPAQRRARRRSEKQIDFIDEFIRSEERRVGKECRIGMWRCV